MRKSDKIILNNVLRKEAKDMREKEVRIKLKSVIYEVQASLFSDDEDMFFDDEAVEDPEPQNIEINTVGVKRIENGRLEIYYDESEVTGMEGASTSISFDLSDKGIVTMLREGSVSTALVFESGRRHHCLYKTPYMPFEVCVNTLSVDNRLEEDGTLFLDYLIEIRGAKAERTKFEMKIIE
jgi:uncharacterized beta-barrel protein YwiB (DUF1934 family)